MVNYKHIQRILPQVVGPHLEPLGYQFIGNTEHGWAGYPVLLFFQKPLWEDIFGFVAYEFTNMHIDLQGVRERSQSFDVSLWRHKGPQPRQGHDGSNDYRNWLYMPLGQLMWKVLDAKVYPWQYYTWGFSTQQELMCQLRDSVEKLLEYGIPWLENPESENPYPSQ